MAEHLPAAWTETAASPEALADGRRRERRAIVGENTGEYLDRVDRIALRVVAANHQRLFPGPHADGLERV